MNELIKYEGKNLDHALYFLFMTVCKECEFVLGKCLGYCAIYRIYRHWTIRHRDANILALDINIYISCCSIILTFPTHD